MITTLRFNSKDEDDMATYRLMMKALDMHSVIHDVAQELRNHYKHGDYSEDYMKAIGLAHEIFWSACKAYEVDPYE
jgi:hypothetical protein